ncbi:MAG: hypothetical protein ACOY94_04480 [Bacillota bacterium]
MVLVWLAGGALILVAAIWGVSVVIMKAKGGALPVDNDRDINDRYFAHSLRHLLGPALEPEWGRLTPEGWFLGYAVMHRKEERIALYRSDLRLERKPYPVAAIIVTGDLVIPDGVTIECDLWCLGDVTVGKRCSLRALAAEGSIRIGALSTVNRWVDAGRRLYLEAGIIVVNTASAGEELVMETGFRGAKLSAPLVRIASGQFSAAWEAAHERLSVYRMLREQYGTPATLVRNEKDPDWIQAHSACTEGRFWTGPGTVLLHDLVVRDVLEVGEDSVIAGSLHVEGRCLLGRRAMVTGNLSCKHLTMQSGAVVGGSVQVDGDAILEEGAIVGLLPDAGGLAVTGSLQLNEAVAVTGRVQANGRLMAGRGHRKVG